MARAALGVSALAALALSPAPLRAADLTATPADYRAQIAALMPGDVLTLAAGTYDGLLLRDLAGEPGRPIEIRGPTSGPRAVIAGRSCCSTISLANVAYLTLRELDVDQRGELVDAIKAEADGQFTHHVTLDGLAVYGFAQALSTTGIETRCPSWDWTIRRTRVEDAGEGLILGSADGRAPFVRGVLEWLLVTDPIGAAIVIERQGTRPATPGLPTEDTVTVIRHSVLIKAARAGVGPDARATIRVGAPPTSGVGQGDRVELYGNFVFENVSLDEGLVRAEGNVAVHDNLLVNSLGAALTFEAVTDAPRELAIYHNTIYASGRAVLISGAAAGTTQRVRGNAIFSASPTPIAGGMASDNVIDTLGRAGDYVVSPTIMLGALDLYPRGNGRLEGAAVALDPFAAHLDADRDFNGALRPGTFRGAYAGSAPNPGWALARAFKAGAVVGPSADAGASPDAALDAALPDAAVADPDAGAPLDATPAADAPARADAGTAPSSRDSGCGCQSAGPTPGAALWLLLGALLALARLHLFSTPRPRG